MTKRILLVLLSFVLCLTTLAGCQPANGDLSSMPSLENSSENSSEDSSVPSIEPFTPPEGSIKLRWAVTEFAQYVDCDGWLDTFNRLLQEKGYDFYLEVVYITDLADGGESYYNALKEAEDIDIASRYATPLELILDDFFIPLDDYLAQDSAKPLRDLHHPYVWEGAKFRGKTYYISGGWAVPTPLVVRLNKKYISQELINSFSGKLSDLVPIFEQVQGEAADFTMVWYAAGEMDAIPKSFSEWIADTVILPNDGSGAQSPTRYQPLKDYLLTMHQFYKAGYFQYHSALLMDHTGSVISNVGNLVEDDRYAAHIVNTSSRSVLVEDGWVAIKLREEYLTSEFGLVGITTTSEHKDEAFALLQAVYTDSDLSNCLAYGTEGVDYEIYENGCATLLGVKPGDIAVDAAGVEYTPKPNIVHSSFFGVYNAAAPVFDEVEGNDRKAYKQNLYENEVTVSPYLGKCFDPTGYEELIAELTAIWEENCDLIWQSDDFEAELARVDALLQEAGIDTLIAAVNEQYGIEP